MAVMAHKEPVLLLATNTREPSMQMYNAAAWILKGTIPL